MTTLPVHEDCQCPRAVHRHGSYVTYTRHQCRCDACRNAIRVTHKRRNLRKLSGSWDWVDPPPVREHVRALQATGMGVPRIAQEAGVPRVIVDHLLYGRPDRLTSQRIHKSNAERILALTPDPALVDATGTRRRFQALIANGWTATELGRLMGWKSSTPKLHLETKQLVTRGTRDAVKALYERLWNVRPPAGTRQERRKITLATSLARKHGWLPPMAWDDDTIDNPHAEPHMPKDANPSQKVTREDLEHMIPWAESTEELARMLGVTLNSIHTILARHGIELPRRFRVVADELREARQSAASRRPRGVAA